MASRLSYLTQKNRKHDFGHILSLPELRYFSWLYLFFILIINSFHFDQLINFLFYVQGYLIFSIFWGGKRPPWLPANEGGKKSG